MDLNQLKKSPQREFDLCIVGSGPAGLSLVSQFFDTNISVVLLESGPPDPSEQHDRLNNAISTGEREVDAVNSRLRCFGGASRLWAGVCAPMSKRDLEGYANLEIDGWPISLAELEEYYAAAAELLQVNMNSFSKPVNALNTQLGDAFSKLELNDIEVNVYAKAQAKDLSEALQRRLVGARNIKILTNATVLDFHVKNNQIKSVVTSTIAGKKFDIKARYFALCTGALEVPRLLLASSLYSDHGVPKHLGRNFMSHPAFTKLANITLVDSDRSCVNKRGGENSIDYELLEKDIKKLNILRHNIFMSPTYIQKEKVVNSEQNFAVNLGIKSKIEDLFCRLIGKRRWSQSWSVSVGIEQEPQSQRRLQLANQVDDLGMRKLIIDAGSITSLEKKTILEALKGLGRALVIGRLGFLEVSQRFLSGEYLERQDPINHHIGTAKMGSTKEAGVVDKNLKVFDFENIYISSSAVFPTSSNVNPTFTIVALSLRLGAHLKKRIQENVRS